MYLNGFLYASNETGCHLAKIGSGYNESLPGHVYQRSKECIEPSLYVQVGGVLVQRPTRLDKDRDVFGYILENGDLSRGAELRMEDNLKIARGEVRTTGLLASNELILWIKQVTADTELLSLLPHAHVSILDTCSISKELGKVALVERQILLKSNDSSKDNVQKILELLTKKNETMEELVKFPADSQSTSCGLRLSTLQESAIVNCDNFLTIFSPNPDSRSKSTKHLGTAYSYSLETGVLSSQQEMNWDPGLVPPTLPKGFSINSSGVLYNIEEHKFWTVTYNRFDEFEGVPGLESGSCLKRRLLRTRDQDDVTSQLLDHAAVLALKHEVRLEQGTLAKFIKIMAELWRKKKFSGCVTAITFLANARFDWDERVHASLVPILDQVLQADHVACIDQKVIDLTLNLRLGNSLELVHSFPAEFEALLNRNLSSHATRFLRLFYLKRMTAANVQPSKIQIEDIQWQLFLSSLRQEMELNASEVIEWASKPQPESVLGRNSSLDQLTETICLVGQWATEAVELRPLFEESWKVVCGCASSLLAKLSEMKPLPPNLDVMLSKSIVSGTLIGVASSYAHQVGLAPLGSELLHKVAHLLRLTTSSEEKSACPAEALLPWVFTRNLESPHPVKDGFKLQETVKLPGAKCLLLVFSDKCSTLTDMDKLGVYSGISSQGGKKVFECSGGGRGGGVRKLGQKTWPKKPLLVFGDTVSIDFEVRSKQDASSWGLQVFVGHCPSDVFETSIPSNLESCLFSLMCLKMREISALFRGQPITAEEEQCKNLLGSKILQRCKWKSNTVEHLLQTLEKEHEAEVPLTKLIPSKTVCTLRTLFGMGLPIMRETTKRLIRPHLLEEAIVSAIIKHMCLEDTLAAFLKDQDPNTPDGCLLSDIIVDVYLKISSLIRRLQAIAEMEAKWNNEVLSLREGLIKPKELFFNDYPHHETKTKELELLCFLKQVRDKNPQKAIVHLRAALEQEACSNADCSTLSQTKLLVKGIFCRLDLLLRIDTENTEGGGGRSPSMMSTSLQNWPPSKSMMKRQNSSDLEKALDDSILQISRLQRSMSKLRQSRSIVESSNMLLDLHANPESIVQELFSFIGNNPEDSVAGSVFLKAIRSRLQRSGDKLEAIFQMKSILKSIQGHAPSIQCPVVASIAECLTGGLMLSHLYSSQRVTSHVLEEFTELLEDLVRIVATGPESHPTTIALLCGLPYQRDEEVTLLRSGLLTVLDDLTSNQVMSFEDPDRSRHISNTAWVGFKLVAKRCVSWESAECSSANRSPSHLEKLISKLLSNHLNQATRCGHRLISVEAVQEALSLLKDLVSSKLGKGILAQPSCISNLFSFLVDDGLSPHTTQTVIQLLQIALPLMPKSDLAEVRLTGAKKGLSHSAVCHLLLDKLGQLISPCVNQQSSANKEDEAQEAAAETLSNLGPEGPGEGESHQALLLHKRPDQSGHELIQQLLNASSDIGIFSAMGSDSMEKVIKIDKDINQKNCAEVMVSDATKIFRSAIKMSELGFVVSIASPNQFRENSNGWKQRSLQICLERNNAVAKIAPTRPFISSSVANKLASEIIVLVYRLLGCNYAEPWRTALEDCIGCTMMGMTQFFNSLSSMEQKSQAFDLKMYRIGQNLTAALAILGGFYETLKPGSSIKLRDSSGENSCAAVGVIKQINKESYTALVAVNLDEEVVELKVPLHQVELDQPVQGEAKKLLAAVACEQIPLVQMIFLPDDKGTEPLCNPLPTCTNSEAKDALCRLGCEIRTRICQVLALHARDESFCQSFLQQSCQSLDMLKYFAKEAGASDKLCCTEYLCENLRGKFKDQTKPSQASALVLASTDSANQWNTLQVFPPLKSLVLTHNGSGVIYQGTPITSIGFPRGVVIQATHGLQRHAAWFVTSILSLGDGAEEPGTPTISIGLSPPCTRKEGAWNHADGAIMYHSNGRLVHYKGPNLLLWKSIRVDHIIGPGDEICVRWQPASEASNGNGSVSFEVNGNEIHEAIHDIPLGLLPTLHIQQKGVRTRTTFASLQSLPSIQSEDTVDRENEETKSLQETRTGGHRRQQPALARQAIRMKPSGSYDPDGTAKHYRLGVNGYSKLQTGHKPIVVQDDEWLEEEEDEDFDLDVSGAEEKSDDLNSLLVRSWEDKVFPSIRRRFRNESERRDGLEQIKGALSLGMIDIAKQTVEFLYEENGGVPADLRLPDIDDVKKDLLTLSIEKLRPGMIVEISGENEVQPIFACQHQFKTFGLEGEVVQTDLPNELAEIETYIEEDGTVVRYWYPIDYLKKSSNERQVARGHKNFSASATEELFSCEFILSRLYCREAFLGFLLCANKNALNVTALHSPEMHATLMSNVLLLQEWDVENLLHLTNWHAWRCHSVMQDTSLALLGDPGAALSQIQPRMTMKIFNTLYELLLGEMTKIFTDMAKSNETVFNELCLEVISSLKEHELSLPYEDLPVNDISMLSTTIYFPSACMVISDLKFGKTSEPKLPESMKVVLGPVEYTFKTKNLQHSSNIMVKYPMSVRGGKHVHLRNFSPSFFTTNVMKICHSGAADSDVHLQLTGVTDKLALALLFVEMMLKTSLGDGLLAEVLESLATMIQKFDLPPTLKTSIFYTTSEVAAKCSLLLGQIPNSKSSERLLERLFAELPTLYDKETKGSGTSLYSYYLQSVVELCFQLQPLANQIALESPKVLDQVGKAIHLLRSIKQSSQPSKDCLESLPIIEANNFSRQYLVLSGVPHLMTEASLRSVLEATLATIKGLKLIELCYIKEMACAVIQIPLSSLQQLVKEAILQESKFYQTSSEDVLEDTGMVRGFVVSRVLANYHCEEPSCEDAWIHFLKHKLLKNNATALQINVEAVLESIFNSSLRDEKRHNIRFADLLMKKRGSFLTFLNGMKNRPLSDIRDDLRDFFNAGQEDQEQEALDFDGFKSQIVKALQKDPLGPIKGFQSCGYDLNMTLCGSIGSAEKTFTSWSVEQDHTLIAHLNKMAFRYNLRMDDLRHQEFNILQSELTALEQSSLSGKTEEEVRSRIALLKSLNQTICLDVVPFVNFDSVQGLSLELKDSKRLLLTQWKFNILNSLLNATAEKNEEQPGVTISLNPIDHIEGGQSVASTWFFQSYQVMSEASSSLFCTQIPHSDDPLFPITIKMVGEEVQGNSGSFRHFINTVIEELQGTSLPMLMPYMGNGPYKGMYQLQPQPPTLLTEKLLVHFGQLLGIAVRSGIPLPIGLMPHFWMGLVDEPIPDKYLASFDPDLDHYLQAVLSVPTNETFETFLEDHQFPTFVCQSIDGEDIDLIEGGSGIPLTFDNRQQYAERILAFRRREIVCKEKMNAILAGLYTIIPMGLVRGLFTWEELQLKICGTDEVDLHLLKKFTIYQVGISEDDRHIQDFWKVLFSLTTSQLKSFLRFACNQERIPKPQQEGDNLPPPYPMKIAPADSREEAQDRLLIRAETCIFMVKIPRYSSYDVMRDKILYSIQSAEDPLSG